MLCHTAHDRPASHLSPPGLLLIWHQTKSIFLSLLSEKFNNYGNNDDLTLYSASFSLTYLRWYLTVLGYRKSHTMGPQEAG